ncbi:hypothetical protein EV657_12034 [Rhodovulum visakhapatnamense]|uniref:Uncharacterized protein n=1 Tax=Rhodovulum visakhapatnamense TaxID=364297 RepID=A0A4R8FHB2_9RHOB|nr:hypothetical protein EV657_12034 [Rhodovulum visakhapatnamense]
MGVGPPTDGPARCEATAGRRDADPRLVGMYSKTKHRNRGRV